MATIKTLRLEQLRTDGGTQQRVRMPDEAVAEYAEALLEGAEFPPVVAFFDGKNYWLADGFIRCLAHKAAQRETIRVDVREGTQRDAVLFSCGANAKHGLRRTNDDKRQAIRTLLKDREWSRRSDAWVAEAASVTNHTVSKVRRDMQPQDGIFHPGDDSVPIPEPRIGRDGKTYPSTRPPEGVRRKGESAAPQPAAATTARPSANGTPVFDDRLVTDLLGKLTRAVSDRSRAFGETARFKAAWRHLEAFAEAWEAWQKERA